MYLAIFACPGCDTSLDDQVLVQVRVGVAQGPVADWPGFIVSTVSPRPQSRLVRPGTQGQACYLADAR